MIEGERVVAVVPARGGSKGVPLKNLQPLGGRPLVAWTVEAALATPEIDRVLVSTDHAGIAAAARAAGAEVAPRPAALAGDEAQAVDLLRHLIAELRAAGESARYLVLLQPTSPFRRPADIRACLERLHGEGLDSVATFTEATQHPQLAWRIAEGRPEPFAGGAFPWRPRQQLPPAHQLNGCVYALVADRLGPEETGVLFGRAGAVVMPAERSLDINYPLDFVIADALLASGLLS